MAVAGMRDASYSFKTRSKCENPTGKVEKKEQAQQVTFPEPVYGIHRVFFRDDPRVSCKRQETVGCRYDLLLTPTQATRFRIW